MKIIYILATVVLFYNCSSKKETKPESLIDSGFVEIDTNTYDGGFSELGREFRKITYDSILIMNCEHEKLSSNFNVHVYVEKRIDTTELHVSSTVKIFLFDKTNKILFDSIELLSEFHGSVFKDCKNVRSYSTRFNSEKEILDNNYGDIVIADFNFDNKEDIALIKDSGGNGGPLYSFFIQNKDRKFLKDVFLTDSMEFFPAKIDKTKRTLTTYVHVGACESSEKIYSLNVKTNIWKEESHKILNICE